MINVCLPSILLMTPRVCSNVCYRHLRIRTKYTFCVCSVIRRAIPPQRNPSVWRKRMIPCDTQDPQTTLKLLNARRQTLTLGTPTIDWQQTTYISKAPHHSFHSAHRGRSREIYAHSIPQTFPRYNAS